MKDKNNYPYTWQYNGVECWATIYHWCKTTYGNNFWTNHNETLGFKNEADWTVFILKWL